MLRLKPGDRVTCRLKEGDVVASYTQDYDDVRTFEIIAQADSESGEEYYVFVPEYIFIKNSVTVDHYRCKKLGISLRFVGEQMAFVNESMIRGNPIQLDGMCCSICQDFIPMATCNQEDGTLVCWACRQNPMRKFR
jgi:hypothetical protein